MISKRAFKIFFIFLLGSFILSLVNPQRALAKILFSDDFETGNAIDWSPNSTLWKIEEVNGSKRYGANINTGSTIIETYAGDSTWDNYIYKVDMYAISGDDKNLIFRVIDSNKKYGLHMRNDLISLEKYDPDYGISEVIYPASFVNNVLYRLKIIVNNNNIKVYSNDSLLIDHTDTNFPITHGKIGLRVGTGANYPSSVWFDNVLVTTLDEPEETPTPIPTETPTQTPTPTLTPTPTPPTPVVFLPGLGGSFNFKEMFLGVSDPDGWRMTPGANVYKNIQNAFEGSSDFFVFYYDWRKPVLENAQKLNDYIQNTVKPWNNKVDLIGHSLGGLVARTCVQKTANNCYVDKLITVGSPHYGAVDAYPALEGGEIWRSGPIKLGYELLVHYFQQPGETRRETIERIAPVLKDLLPTFAYLEKNGVSLSPEDLSFKNTLLPDISNLSLLENITHTISGVGFNSVEKIVLTEPNWVDKLLGNWPDGKPEQKIYSQEGDSSVLLKSASFNNANIPNSVYNFDHGGIISKQEPLTKIMEILGLSLKPGDYNSLNDEENFLVFLAHSPVKLSSPDITTENYIDDNLLIIPSPENKVYKLNVEGTGNGFYTLSVGKISSQSANWQDYYGETQTGKIQNFQFNINLDNLSEDPLENRQNFCEVESNVLLDQIRDLANSQISNSRSKTIIFSLLNLIAKEKNNPEIALDYINLLRNTIATLEKQGNLSSSFANQARKYLSEITACLEEKAFANPKITAKIQATSYLNSAKTMLNQMESLHNFNKAATLIFLEAKEKLNRAQNSFILSQYYQTKILAKNIIGLLLEVKILSR